MVQFSGKDIINQKFLPKFNFCMNYWLEIKAMSATEVCNFHIKIQWGNGRKKLEVVCQWVGERNIGEKN